MELRTIRSSLSRAAMFASIAFAAAGCSTSRWYDARFSPAPAEVAVSSPAVAGSSVRALASVLGVARPDAASGRAKQVEMRVRLENLGTVGARVEPDAFALLSADLQPFGAAVTPAGANWDLPPGETRTLDVAFGVPEGDRDWGGLNFRFALSFGATKVTAGTTFERVRWTSTYARDPWPYDRGYGYGWYAWGRPYGPVFGYCW